MRLFHLFFLALLTQNCIAQKSLDIHLSRSFHGTGDIRGWGFNVEYNKNINPRFSWSISLGSTIHDGNIPVFYEYPSGNAVDGSIRYTTAGFQTMFSIGYDFIKADRSSLLFKIGVPLRYQSSSYYDNVILLYEPITSLPYPVIIFRNTTPQKTVAIGLSPQIAYKHLISKKTLIGVSGSFQFDSNGDNISFLSFTIGRRL